MTMMQSSTERGAVRGWRRLVSASLLVWLTTSAFAQAESLRRQVRDDLRAYVEQQRQDKAAPGIWLAVLSRDPVSGEEWTWAVATGDATPPDRSASNRRRAAVDDVHRVASVSKLFTATLAVLLAEQGRLDLDAPVTDYLPDFAPETRYTTSVTVRHLLGHRAGLVRESPVGHYFDPTAPGLADTVASLNDTELVSEPGTAIKYSNPGPGVVGRVIEVVTGKSFEDAVQEMVLRPLGMQRSSFAEREDLLQATAYGEMWTYDGRFVPTPSWPFGYGPAANLRSTVSDLMRFARSWLPGVEPRVLSERAQASMWAPQGGGSRGCGLGFFIGPFDGVRRVRHGGAVYGFATSLQALPSEGLAACAVVTVDFANDVADAVVELALRTLRAERKGQRLGLPALPSRVGVDAARALAGRYEKGGEWFDLMERGGELYFDPCIGVRSRMRQAEDGRFVADGRMAMANRTITAKDGGVVHDGFADFTRIHVTEPPPPAPAELLDYLGEYGWDHNTLIVYEDGGRLSVLIEWLVRDQLEREGPDRFRFPPGMYGGDQLRFERDAEGKVMAAVVGGARMERRPDPADDFRIRARGMIKDLRAEARRASLPARLAQQGSRRPDLVDLRTLDPSLKFDIRYTSANNFLGEPVYEREAPMLQRSAAEALLRAHRALEALGYGFCIFDGYRPWSVTKVFWDATPDDMRHFVANPKNGSRHNRGCAVDLTLYDRTTGEVVPMPSGYDEFTARAYPDWPGSTSRQRWHRELLRRAMEDAGFEVYEHEWWHFDHKDWREYPVLNEPLK
jgi:D-alanyl-D-alanine dipeptidase/CubicO group peptidase (beta-lactamase class C family)